MSNETNPIDDEKAANRKINRELLGLLSALCDGEMTAAQQARLEQLLEADAACRLQYLEYIDLHAHLLSQPNAADLAAAARVRAAEQGAGAKPALRRARLALGYIMVAAGTLAATLLLQVIWWQPAGTTENPDAVVASRSDYVATLAQTVECVWEDAAESRRAGSRLVPCELRLRSGISRICFESGAELIIEGPTNLRLDSATAATVLRGKVVFRADELAAPFVLRTPTSTLLDLGTEYAVSVDIEGEEVHVFEGEVQRKVNAAPKQATPELLKAGEARRYGLMPEASGQPAKLDSTTFVRQVGNPNLPLPDPTAGLLAYEGFDYSDPELFRTGKANGGSGWKGPWIPSLIRPYTDGERNLLTLNPRSSLQRKGSAAPSLGGSFDYIGFTKYQRRLATPIRLDVDSLYYLSFLFRRDSPSTDPINAVAILLKTTEDLKKEKTNTHKRLNLGVGGPNQIFTHLGSAGSRTPVPLNYAETYLFVAKIAAGATGPDQVFIRVYGPQESVERDEPSSWTVVGPAFRSDLVFDWLEVHINSRTRQTIDEIRLGTTWSSVAGPWIGNPVANKEKVP